MLSCQLLLYTDSLQATLTTHTHRGSIRSSTGAFARGRPRARTLTDGYVQRDRHTQARSFKTSLSDHQEGKEEDDRIVVADDDENYSRYFSR